MYRKNKKRIESVFKQRLKTGRCYETPRLPYNRMGVACGGFDMKTNKGDEMRKVEIGSEKYTRVYSRSQTNGR